MSQGVSLMLYLDNHICCRSSIVSNGYTATFHDFVQGSKKRVSLLHFSCSLFSPPGSNEKTSLVMWIKHVKLVLITVIVVTKWKIIKLGSKAFKPSIFKATREKKLGAVWYHQTGYWPLSWRCKHISYT